MKLALALLQEISLSFNIENTNFQRTFTDRNEFGFIDFSDCFSLSFIALKFFFAQKKFFMFFQLSLAQFSDFLVFHSNNQFYSGFIGNPSVVLSFRSIYC